MATEQNEPKLPLSNKEKRATADLLPRFYRTDSNKKFLQATLDQLVQPGTVKKINGFIGRQNAKAVSTSDIFLKAADTTRQNYQLEPAAVIQDYLGNVNFYKDYIDHINHIDVFGGNTNNHQRLNKQEFYSWTPHICWDKFINYQNYYWLPYGPAPIEISGIQQGFETTFTVGLVDEDDNYAYVFGTDALVRNPTITLYRGQTYTFEITAPNNPFTIKTSRVAGELEKYINGVSASSVQSGTITFTIPLDAPDILYYVSEASVDTAGVFQVLDITENTFLDVEENIIGKKYYTSSSNIKFSNGMKLKFTGNVTPEKYADDYWYVEGVGTAIKLISEKELEIISGFTEENSLLFDDAGFDQDPFSTATAYAGTKDYIVINRASPDRNPWSRYNRWFHEDVIKASATILGNVPELDQSARAIRPIIEFEAGLKLFNFGHEAKKNVDVIDIDTTDVFSTIEGSLGYNVDGIDLTDGMRVLFAADTDSLVNGKIFKVNFINVNETGGQIEFSASRNVDPNGDRITFDIAHRFATGNQVFYLNNGNLDISGLTNRKIYYVRVIDTQTIELYNDKALTLRVNILDTGTGAHKLEIFSGIRRQINLVEESDSIPQLNETVLVKYGKLNRGTVANPVYNQGSMYWYDGVSWKLGQRKTSVNQQPFFDVFDNNTVGYSDLDSYDSSTFKGTKVFSYKVGTGVADPELGFALSYQNINNIGDITFEFNLLNDVFEYKVGTDVKTKKTDVGYLRLVSSRESFSYVNGWTTSSIENAQPIVRIFKGTDLIVNPTTSLITDFPIDVFSNLDNLSDLAVRVYINGIRVNKKYLNNGEYVDTYSVVDILTKKYVRFNTGGATVNDIVTLKFFSKQSKNGNGYYEVPINLQNNPLNNNLSNFTLGEVSDHVNSIIDNIDTFEGKYPGTSNLRDIGNVSAFGTRFVQHSGPLNLSLYHLGSRTSNVFAALEQARDDYSKFKRAFIIAASSSGIDTDPPKHVDYVLSLITKDKAKMQPYYLSDMFGYSGANRLEYTVLDSRTKTYPLSSPFSLKSLTSRAIYVYLNGEQLIYGKDYEFGTDVFFTILVDLAENDLIEVYEYESTDGTYCPPTPTKLGLYPKFEPKKYIDTSYIEPTEVIQGHDGSITIAFGDYRDDLILELEKRIYNNIKVEYDSALFDIYDYIPGYNRTTDYTKEEFEKILSTFFFQWSTTINQDYTAYTGWDRFNPFTFNYRGNYAPDGSDVPAYWRGIYKWLLDTDRPNTHPWECLGFSIEPTWWKEVYGPAPYTSDNFILWDDLRQGIVRQPNIPIRVLEKFVRPVLETCIPVDEVGNLLSPLNANMANGLIKATDEGFFIFGDQGPVETAWRKSSHYTFALIQAALLMQPNKVLATGYDRSRIVKNLSGQIIYSDTELRIKLDQLVIPSTASSSARVMTAGLVNYIIDYITSDVTTSITQYQTDLSTLTNNIGSKLGGFSSKPKFRLMLDSKSVASTAGVFVPEENYKLVLNTSSPIKKLIYSGVIVTKFDDGFEIRGYNIEDPYFKYYAYTETDRVIRVGGISETFVNWEEDKFYAAGKIVRVGSLYYRVKVNHTTSTTFDENFYTKLAELPVIGGREGILRKSWDTRVEEVISYGTKLPTVQEVVDFLQGYGKYLEEQGFVFDEYNSNLRAVTNWETSVKEFLFWTTQNWAEGSVLSMSPAATKLILRSVNSVVNNIRDEFYNYKIFRVDGQKLEPEFTNTYRSENEFTLIPQNTSHGIYAATLYLVQKEHVLILDNRTLFNDIIYDLEPGYRQERIKVLGYISTNWTGGFNIPGFIYDQATINEWTQWTDYNLGDIVKYKEFYYTAKKFLPGAEAFNNEDWILQTEKPQSRLLANWDYRSEQFTDFYDLDTDNFNAEEQKLAQHLIGYQKRQYLENIIKDDVSQYKFYQGMIIEKGTQNVFNKLFDVLSADNQESLTFNEEWAVRVGNYGASAAFEEIEFTLDESNFKLNPQPFELVDRADNDLDFIIQQQVKDVYIKPVGYNNNPWPMTGTKRFLRSPGFVRYEDVKLNVDTLADVIDEDISDFQEGDYVWCAFEGRDWNVYRFTKTTFRVVNVEYADGILTIKCDRLPELTAGDIIGIENSELIKGFHTISSVSLKDIVVEVEIQNWEEFSDSSEILTYKFTSSRVSIVDEINNIIPRSMKRGELVWIDNAVDNHWAVFKHNDVYALNNIEKFTLSTNLNFGKKVSLTPDGNTAAVTDSRQVTIFEKATGSSTWTQVQVLTREVNVALEDTFTYTEIEDADGFFTVYYNVSQNTIIETGTKIRLSRATGISNIDTTRVYFVFGATTTGFKIALTLANANSGVGIVPELGDNSFPERFTGQGIANIIPGQGFGIETSFSNDGEWLAIAAPNASNVKTLNNNGQLVVSAAGLASDKTNQGYVNLYRRSSSSTYYLVTSFVSQDPRSGELFGSKMKFAKLQPAVDNVAGTLSLVRNNYVISGLSNTNGLLPGMRLDKISGVGNFGTDAVIAEVNDTEIIIAVANFSVVEGDIVFSAGSEYVLIVTSPYYNSTTSKISFYKTSNYTWVSFATPLLGTGNFGQDLSVSNDGTVLVIPASQYNEGLTDNDVYGRVYLYKLINGDYSLVDTLNKTRLQNMTVSENGTIDNGIRLQLNDQFGKSVALSQSGNMLAVGASLVDDQLTNQGKVFIFNVDTTAGINLACTRKQQIDSPFNESFEQYGEFVSFCNNDKTLVVYSANGDAYRPTTFDNFSSTLGSYSYLIDDQVITSNYVNDVESDLNASFTTFDNATLKIVDYAIDSGRVDVYDTYNSKFVFGESLDTDMTSDAADDYGMSIAAATNTILVGAPLDSDRFSSAGSVYSYVKDPNIFSWEILHRGVDRPNANKIKKAYLYNTVTDSLTTYLDVVDPIQGKIPGPAEQEIKYKTYFDPAIYSIGSGSVNVDDGSAWTTSHVGMLWWDLTRAKFLENQTDELVYRSTAWNTLYETASIDVYEWVQSRYLPSEWDELADTTEGLALGISGTSRYSDTVYSIKRRYDSASRSFINTYFFWVKNKTVVPDFVGRTLSANDVADLIADPVSSGYTCLALTGSNSFSLINCQSAIEGTFTNLNVQYWIVDNQEVNNHSQWKIISEHPNTVIPPTIESKWLHSLAGKDDFNRSVPDFTLPFKIRYGIENRPRQGMFVNRIEALKQYFERVNSVLINKLIVDDYDLTDLEQLDPLPTKNSGLWDTVVDTEEELRFVGTASLRTASLIPVIENGRIVEVVVVDSGYGYINVPAIKIVSSGIGAELQAVLDEVGQISRVDVIESGTGYLSDTMLSVRPYSVLVRSDSTTFDKWSIYSWNKTKSLWDKVKSQSFDVTKFWQYVDWYYSDATITYNQFTKIDYLVDNTYQLVTLDSDIGSVVKVKNVGTGGWLLLLKYANTATIDYTQNYRVIGRQNGTIKFLDSLYRFKNSVLGFDGSLFDAAIYDDTAATELKIILNTIKDKIFVDELRIEYLKLFFASIRYAMNEQLTVDWAFKTSFIKATHNVGALTQKVSYNNDNLENFEDYVNEVKPYKSKVREYVSSYSNLDTAQSSVTDFDIIPTVDSTLKIDPVKLTVSEDGTIVSSSEFITAYPWKHWLDNVGFTIQSIEIVDGGSGYINPPVVRIDGGFGTGAVARAYISTGRVNRIQLISPGTGYLKAPIITLDGGLREDGRAATAVAIIESEVVRSNKISIKFDRVSKTYFIRELTETETFIGTGSRLQFALKWSPNAVTGKSRVTINGSDALRTDYSLTTKKSTTRGYTSYSGLLTLNVAPAIGDVIEVTYEKDFNHMAATDRINFFYNPETGQLGKDLAQLMTGVDYGGVNISGLGFGLSGGWDSLPWFTDAWDGFDAQFDDYIVVAQDSTYSYTLPYVPADGELINIYVNGVRVDDPYYDAYDGVTVQPNGRKVAPDNTVINTFIGNGSTDTITLPLDKIDINDGDKIIFRKSTSDGSQLPRADEYDTQLTGGNLAYTTATGYAPDDINLDGDGFVTPTTSHAPEEVVPGQLADAVSIKVFHRPTSGAPVIMFKNYVADGLENEFVIGQQFPTPRSVIVKVNSLILESSQYTLDIENNKVILTSTPSNKSIVTIISLGFNSENVLDLDYFVADGSTDEFITHAPWLDNNLSSTVLVNGTVVNYDLFRTDDSYEHPGLVGIRFGNPPDTNAVINYVIDINTSGELEYSTSAVTKSQTIVFDGSTQTYDLTNLTAGTLPGVGLTPYESNVLVRKGQEILRSPMVMYYTIKPNQLVFNIPTSKFVQFGLEESSVRMAINGNLLVRGRDYVLDLSAMIVTISANVYIEGAKLSFIVDVDADYRINDNGTITFTNTYPEGTVLEVITFYNHRLLDIERTVDLITPASELIPETQDFFEFTGKSLGKFVLRNSAISDDYVWVIKNGTLLTSSVDYFLDEDHVTVNLAEPLISTDVIQVMAFSNRVTRQTFGYMQFKDMLNRVHYKRISQNKTTRLARDLIQTDTEIYVVDGSVLSIPNPALRLPGIVEINGERIEYYTKNGNVLGQLRRGTLGTGTPILHRVGLLVIDFGPSETIPYMDQQIVETLISDGTSNNLHLNYIPTVAETSWTVSERGSIPSNYGQSNELEVFVGGYNIVVWETNTTYYVGDTVMYGAYTYKCLTQHTSGVFNDDISNWKFFVGNIHLKKVPYKVYNVANAPDSPEGDVQFEADFSVNGTDNAIRITNDLPANTKILVIKKTGKIWNDLGKSLVDSDNQIANFLKSSETIWPQYLSDKYQYVLSTDELYTIKTEDNNPLELD